MKGVIEKIWQNKTGAGKDYWVLIFCAGCIFVGLTFFPNTQAGTTLLIIGIAGIAMIFLAIALIARGVLGDIFSNGTA